MYTPFCPRSLAFPSVCDEETSRPRPHRCLLSTNDSSLAPGMTSIAEPPTTEATMSGNVATTIAPATVTQVPTPAERDANRIRFETELEVRSAAPLRPALWNWH
jgi:hypothetical protein